MLKTSSQMKIFVRRHELRIIAGFIGGLKLILGSGTPAKKLIFFKINLA